MSVELLQSNPRTPKTSHTGAIVICTGIYKLRLKLTGKKQIIVKKTKSDTQPFSMIDGLLFCLFVNLLYRKQAVDSLG